MQFLQNETRRLLLLFAVSYLYCLVWAPLVAKRKEWKRTNALHESCVVDTSPLTQDVLAYSKWRGSEYYIGVMDARKRKMLDHCLLTFWGATHIFLYFCVGLLCPGHAAVALGVGVGFEVYEAYVLECHDILDIFWNALGLIAGRMVGQAIWGQ